MKFVHFGLGFSAVASFFIALWAGCGDPGGRGRAGDGAVGGAAAGHRSDDDAGERQLQQTGPMPEFGTCRRPYI